MSNVYLKYQYQKELNDNIISSITDNIVANLHHKNREPINESSDDIFSCMKDLGYEIDNSNNARILNKNLNKKSNQSAMVVILKKLLHEYYEQQDKAIKEELQEQIIKLKLKPTSNVNIMKSNNDAYYRLKGTDFVEDKSIIKVNSDGSYLTKEKIIDTGDYLITKFNTNNEVIALKIENFNNKICKIKSHVAKKLNLKQEFVKKHKLHGYCGNSSGLGSKIKNLLSSPIPSGCYFKNYRFFVWNADDSQFELQIRQGCDVGSPLLADYDIRENFVVRTDYDGVGICE